MILECNIGILKPLFTIIMSYEVTDKNVAL